MAGDASDVSVEEEGAVDSAGDPTRIAEPSGTTAANEAGAGGTGRPSVADDGKDGASLGARGASGEGPVSPAVPPPQTGPNSRWVANCWARLVHCIEECRDALSRIAGAGGGGGRDEGHQADTGELAYALLARTFNDASFRPLPHALVKDSNYPELKDIKPTTVKKKVAPAELKERLRLLKVDVTAWNRDWERSRQYESDRAALAVTATGSCDRGRLYAWLFLEKTQVLEFVSEQARDAGRVGDGLPCVCGDEEAPPLAALARHKRRRVGGTGRDVSERPAAEENGSEDHSAEGDVGQYGGSRAAEHEYLTSVPRALQVSDEVRGRHLDPYDHARLRNRELDQEDKAKKRLFLLQCCEASNPEVSQPAVSLLSSILSGLKPKDLM